MIMEKVTIMEQINAIEFERLTKEQFEFLVERAKKSVRKGSGKKVETKTQKENKVLVEKVVAWIAEGEKAVTCGETAEFLEVEGQKASAILKMATEAGRLVKTEAKGKVKATWTIAE